MRSLLISLVLTVGTQGVYAQSVPLPGEASYYAGDYQKARVELAEAPDHGTKPALILMKARIDIAENKLLDARTQIDRVIKQDSTNAMAYALSGQLYGMQASRASLFRAGGFAKKSLAAFEKALELDPTLEEALVGMIRYRLSAPALFGGSITEAQKVTEALVKLNPVAGKLELAELYGKQGEDDLQVELLREIAKDHPENPRAFVALGYVEQSARNYDKAFEHFSKAVSSGALSAEHTHSAQAARYQMGRTVVLSKTGSRTDIRKGIAALTDYLEGPLFGDLPSYQWAHYRRGLLHERLGNAEESATGDFVAAGSTQDKDLKRALKSR